MIQEYQTLSQEPNQVALSVHRLNTEVVAVAKRRQFSSAYKQRIVRVAAGCASGRHSQYQWRKTETVEVITLDALIEKFGQPTFIKIDVEGYDEEVLAGLNVPVQAISFEFHGEFLEQTRDAITRLSRMAESEFNLSFGESLAFEFDNWPSAPDLLSYLNTVNPNSQGDIYVNQKL